MPIFFCIIISRFCRIIQFSITTCAHDDTKKSDLTYQANNIGYEILYQLEKDINTALASALEEQKNKNAELQETVDSLLRSLDSAGKVPAVNTDILFLKRKAEEIEKLMNNSKAGAQ